MEREIIVRLTVPRWLGRRWMVVIGVMVLGTGALVYATVPNTFNAGEVLSAQKMNDNFNTLAGNLDQIQMRLTALEGSAVTTAAGTMVMGEATIAGDPAGMSACTASTCNVLSKTGWVTGATRFGSGDYHVAIQAGVFSASPNCVVTSNDVTGAIIAVVYNISTSNADVSLFPASGTTTKDDVVSIVCIGPK